MTQRDADVAVVGLGSMGVMALWMLARRGVSAIGLEQFEPGHDRGEGHGESKIIRSCYPEGPRYVPLVQAAFGHWRELERETGVELLTETGAVFIGRPDTGFVGDARHTAETCGLPYEILEPDAARSRFPQHRLEADQVAFFDRQAGLLRPELALRTAAARAEQLGARLVTHARVEAIEEKEDGVEIRTGTDTFRAGQAIVAAGPWTGKLLPQIEIPLWVERQVMAWFRARRPEDFAPKRFPVFIREHGEDRTWYGFPTLDGATIKAALHHGGARSDPDHPDREISAADYEPISALIREALPGLDPEPVRGQTCMYTNTADEHFVIGRPARMQRLILLGPMSGHGFKFAPALGRIGADLALDGMTSLPIESFSPDRFAAAATATAAGAPV
ncbi:MAG: N-methyl-L-tryptophan oxidase [Candidatus Dormibacteraeota bacterium]|nr:N-methyl-L-tryptophan oxidase [Candidatus Dormibacteraeota bacterium]